VEGKNTVFLFSDTQIISESFLEDVTNILSSGEVLICYIFIYTQLSHKVPNLYTSDELAQIREALRSELKTNASKDAILDTTGTFIFFFSNFVLFIYFFS
jgi:P-loop containing dynein motor region D4